MNKFLLAAIAALAALAAGPASAADISVPPYRPPPAPVSVPAPIHNWTGLYLGGAFGYGLWDADTSVLNLATGVSSSVTNTGGRGWVGEAVAGYDYQFAVANFNLVAGVFGDYDFGRMSGTINVGLASAGANTIGGVEKSRSYWDVGGRFGVLITPQILSYWTGGYTQSRFDGITLTATGIGAGPAGPMSVAANTYHGWFTGGGVETQVTSIPGLFFNTEYRYASYTSATLPISGAPVVLGFPANLKFAPHEQTVMSGVRYKFNWPQ